VGDHLGKEKTMSKPVVGDPKLDADAKKAFKTIKETFYASNQFKAGNLKNYDIETLKEMADISRDFAMAWKYIVVRLEQSDGAQKAQINALEKRMLAIETSVIVLESATKTKTTP
jgi:hypothetical protein